MKYVRNLFVAAAMSTVALLSGQTQRLEAATLDVDLMFVIDSSVSMQQEFNTLGARIGEVLTGLTGATNGTNTIGSVQAGLVSYINSPTLRQSLTSNATTLSTVFSGVTVAGGIENALGAVDSVLPGGSLFGSASWRNNTVKSVILITDEDADDENTYSYNGTNSYAGLGAKLDDAKYFNNIITLQSLYSQYDDAARPTSGLFDLNAFRTDATDFLNGFIQTKVQEITTDGTPTGGSNTGVVPLPAAGWLLIAGLGGLAAMRRRQDNADA